MISVLPKAQLILDVIKVENAHLEVLREVRGSVPVEVHAAARKVDLRLLQQPLQLL